MGLFTTLIGHEAPYLIGFPSKESKEGTIVELPAGTIPSKDEWEKCK